MNLQTTGRSQRPLKTLAVSQKHPSAEGPHLSSTASNNKLQAESKSAAQQCVQASDRLTARPLKKGVAPTLKGVLAGGVLGGGAATVSSAAYLTYFAKPGAPTWKIPFAALGTGVLGGVAGGLTGAVVAQSTDDPVKGTAAGAAVGAGLGVLSMALQKTRNAYLMGFGLLVGAATGAAGGFAGAKVAERVAR